MNFLTQGRIDHGLDAKPGLKGRHSLVEQHAQAVDRAVAAQPGDRVARGQTLLIIEAMKTMNQIHAPRAGKVTAIYVDNGHPVEYGEPLVAIE